MKETQNYSPPHFKN